MGYLWWFTGGSLVRGGRMARGRGPGALVRGGGETGAPGRRVTAGRAAGRPPARGRDRAAAGRGAAAAGRGRAAAGRWI